MYPRHLDPAALPVLLRPETALEYALLATQEFQDGLTWGEPRFGHPEGKVGLHVREVLENVDRLPNLTTLQRTQLRLITLAHDTFKCKEIRGTPRDWSKHHGAIARQFMEGFTKDPVVLDIIETHDDAYYAWLNTRRGDDSNLQHKTLPNLLNRVGYCLQMYYLFFKCDTLTGDKTQAPVSWFEHHVDGIEVIEMVRT